jgi:hypothetical protein
MAGFQVLGPQIGRGAFNWDLEKNFDTGNAMGPYAEKQRQCSTHSGRGMARPA